MPLSELLICRITLFNLLDPAEVLPDARGDVASAVSYLEMLGLVAGGERRDDRKS
jgi:hypothetical protein